jgi:predicted O-methyltransferase YrrM
MGILKRLWYKLLASRIEDVVQVLRMHYGAKSVNFATLDKGLIPPKISGFHDLFYLFASHQANRGILAQDVDEAAYIWKTITDRKPANILEIGRWLGGSTVLIASAAAQYGGTLVSVDLKVKAPEYARDELIKDHLARIGLANFSLNIGSSFDFNPGRTIDLAFIDGDHSYEGVKKDLLNTLKYVRPGADLLFHDSCATRPFATNHLPVAKLMKEMAAEPSKYTLVREMGSITHFRVA